MLVAVRILLADCSFLLVVSFVLLSRGLRPTLTSLLAFFSLEIMQWGQIFVFIARERWL